MRSPIRRLSVSLAAFTLVVTPALTAAAYAHGGSYRGPAGEIPPDSRDPYDPPPPAEGSGPKTPGGSPEGGPSTGGPDTGSPTTPSGPDGKPGTPSTGDGSGGPPTPGGGPGGGPNTRGGSRKGAGFAGWAFWWGANKDEILCMRSALKGALAGPTTAVGFGKSSTNSVRGVTDRAITEEIVPALRRLLADGEESFHIRSAAELGLAKIGDTSIAETLRAMASGADRSLHREVLETAPLALGLLGTDDAATREFLMGIVRDPSRDGTHVRSFSAISLGLLGERTDPKHTSAAALFSVVAGKETGVDIKPASFAGLGLLGSESAIAELVAIVKNGRASAPNSERLSETEVAYAVAALGKIGKAGTADKGAETAALDEILRILVKDRSGAANVRRSAAIALGQIGAHADARLTKRILDVLHEEVSSAQDEEERNFSVMSLARIGASATVDPAQRREIVDQLRRTLEKSRGQTPAFAAMALGLVGRAISDQGGAAPEEEVRAPLRARFAAKGDPQIRGAYALASGLVRDPLAAPALLAALKDAGEDKRVRGWAALALGLIRSHEAVEPVRDVLRNELDRELRVQCSMAAGLLGDATVIDEVIKVLIDPDASNYERGSAALALGRIGDERAVVPLISIAEDKSARYPDLTRSLAVVALGQIGDRRDVPTLARFATDVNYRAHVPAVIELLTIL